MVALPIPPTLVADVADVVETVGSTAPSVLEPAAPETGDAEGPPPADDGTIFVPERE